MSKRIAILGGGISGLTAGIYAQKHGFETDIYEKNSVPGGECTGWDRNGFHIDGCIHWLTGSRDDNEFGKVWREIGALGPDVDIYQPEAFCTVNHKGTIVSLYRNLGKLRSHLTEISPEDKAEIDTLCDAIGKASDSGIPMIPPDMMNPMDLIKMIGKMMPSMKMMKTFDMSLEDYVGRFKSPALRAALASVLPLNGSASALPFTMGTICSGNGGRPAGGSRAMALRMAAKYKSLGGRLHLNKEVSRIIVENGKAAGVMLSDGSTVTADYIIPASDIHTTLEKFLDGNYRIPQIDERDADHDSYPSPTCVYAAFGIDADISYIPPDYTFTSSPYTFEDRKLDIVNFKHYCYEPSFAPEGKSVGIVYMNADYDWWKAKAADKEEYKKEKNRLGDELVAVLEDHLPHLKGKIACIDMATPVTYERYCNAWRGSWMSYCMMPGKKQMMLDGRIKGIDNLYMSGQWLMSPGGLPVAIITGRWAVQRICRRERLPWRW